MRNYLKMHGMAFPNSNGLPQIEEREEDVMIANAPTWALFLTPRYEDSVSVAENWVYNPVMEVDSSPSTGEVALGEFPNGSRSLYQTDDAIFNFFQTASIRPDEWTFFAVINPMPRTSPSVVPQYIIRHSDFSPENEHTGLVVGMTGSTLTNLLVYKSFSAATNNPVRLSHAFNFADRGAPSLVMVTFSVERGLAIFDGGEQVAAAPEDKMPLDINTDGDNNLLCLQNCRGDYGPMGILNTDLSHPENTGHRRAIERFLMSKYGIPEGPQ